MKKSKRLLTMLSLCLAAIILLTACGGGGTSQGGGSTSPAGDGGSQTAMPTGDSGGAASGEKVPFTFVIAYENTTLDPHNVNGSWDSLVCLNIHDPLVRMNADGSISPALAESWEISADNMEYTFKLREGVKFHDGTPLKASDVKWSIERAMAAPASARFTAPFEGVEVVDDTHVKLKLKYVCAATLNYLTQANNAIASEEIMNRVGEEAYQHAPVGSGPFIFKEWIPGDRIELEANPDYYLGKADIDLLTIKTMTDTTTSFIALETGSVDAVVGIPAISKPNAESNPNLVYTETSGTAFWTLTFNVELAPFDNKALRQAIGYAIDRQEIIDIALDGAGTVADVPMTANSLGYVDKKFPAMDLEMAKAKLAEAGYPDGIQIHLACREDFTTKIAQVVQQQLARVNIDVTIDVMERSAMLAESTGGTLGFGTFGTNDLVFDATIPMSALDSAYIPATNFAFYNNPEYDRLNALQSAEADSAKRVAVIEEMMDIFYEDVPKIPLFYQTQNITYSSKFTGVDAKPSSLYFIYDFKVA